MAASGNKTVRVTAYDTLKFSWWETSQDIANNRTVIGWKVELIAIDDGRIASTGGDPWSVTVNGSKYNGTCDVSISNNTTKTLASGNTTIAHGNDGKKTFSYSFTVSFDGIYFSGVNIGVKSGSGSGTLTTIPRTSSFTIPSSAAAGVNIPVSITRAVSSFTHDVKLQFGNKTQTYNGIATSVNVVAPLAWLDQIPNAASGTLTVTVTTKSGNTVIGSTSKTMTITVPSSVVPTVSVKAVTPIDQTWGLYIQGKSKVKIELSAAGSYGSAISSYSITGAGYNGTVNPYTTGLLLTAGEQEFTCTVTDSRGRKASVKTKITVTPYEPPKFTDLQAFRANAAGTSDRSGAYAYVKASRAYSSCGGHNSSSMTVAYKAESAGSYGSAVSLEDGIGKVIGGSLATNTRYRVKVTVADYFTSVYQELVIETDQFRAVLGEKAAGLLMYPPEGGEGVYVPGLTVTGDAYLNGTARLPSVWDISYKSIPANSNLNDYLNVGYYRCSSSADAATVVNNPFGGAFLLHVYSSLSTDRTPPTSNTYRYFIQELTAYTGLQYHRTVSFNNSTIPTFGSWVKIFDTSSLPHYITEQGTSGIWTYRKWNSGIAECWGKTAKTISTTTAWGTGLYLDSGGRTYADYPSGLFVDIPVCQFSAEGKSSSVIPMTAGELGTKTRTPQLQFVRGTSSSNMAVTVHWHALGRWK